jgi:hypothetical protein
VAAQGGHAQRIEQAAGGMAEVESSDQSGTQRSSLTCQSVRSKVSKDKADWARAQA